MIDVQPVRWVDEAAFDPDRMLYIESYSVYWLMKLWGIRVVFGGRSDF